MRGVRRAFIFKMLNVKNIPSIYDFTQRYHIKAEFALNKAFILLELRLLTDRIKAEFMRGSWKSRLCIGIAGSSQAVELTKSSG